MFVSFANVGHGSRFAVGPSVGLLPLPGLFDGVVLLAGVEDVLGHVSPLDDSLDLGVGGVLLLELLAVLDGRRCRSLTIPSYSYA